jgi:hypothetical protein
MFDLLKARIRSFGIEPRIAGDHTATTAGVLAAQRLYD